ncbi:GntR family transcriptional regulator [Dermabacter sp. Marseille-Q3180]|uniref:GntR family transcriptional regulator n=1 Tax=Dermabacter sp. Marseille-Q3180 TaxID=2758090 RepID=UPI0020250D97|nr:GntR family transcriptional regulator [Dermabacter sp. Marseille-Q3180]
MAIRRPVLRDEVEGMLLRRLLASQWEPGQKLSIDGLARELEVSPTPVREALVSLEHSGLVEYKTLKGYVVAPKLDSDSVRELIEARLVIEPVAIRKAYEGCSTFGSRLKSAFENHVDRLRDYEDGDDPDFQLAADHHRLDAEFHHVSFECAGNRYLLKIIDTLQPLSHRMRQTWHGSEGAIGFDALDALREHKIILDQVVAQNIEGAQEALRAHLLAVQDRSLRAIKGQT